MYPILTTEAKPDVTMTIICILKDSIRRKTTVGNFMVAFGRKNNKTKTNLEAHWITTAISYFP